MLHLFSGVTNEIVHSGTEQENETQFVTNNKRNIEQGKT